MQSFPIFIINLPTATERRAAVVQQMNKLGLHYEIVEGIFGNDSRVTERYDEKLSIKERGKPLTIGERGCALAHALIYDRMLREHIPVALILEDDIVLADDILLRIESEIKKNNGRWGWLSFDYRYVGLKFLYHWLVATIKTVRQKPTFAFYAFAKMFYIPPLTLFEGFRNWLALTFPVFQGAKGFYRPLFNAGAYLVTQDGARQLSVLNTPLHFTADELPNVARRRSGLRMLGYVPLCVRQNTADFATDAGLTNQEWERIFASTENR